MRKPKTFIGSFLPGLLLVGLGISAAASPAVAQAREKKPPSKTNDEASVPVQHHGHHRGAYDMFILGGGKAEADADKIAKRVNEEVYALKWAKKSGFSRYDLVQVVKSDTVKGLNPGFFIAVAGFCSHDLFDADRREDVLKAMRKLEPGAYVRHVHEEASSINCPELWSSSLYPDLQEHKLRARIDKAEKAGGKKLVAALVDYAIYLKNQARLVEAEVFVGAALKIDPDDKAANDLGEVIMVLLTD